MSAALVLVARPLLALIVALAVTATVPTVPQPAPDDPGPSAAGIRTADDLLRALEASEADLRDFAARIRWEKEQGLVGDVQIRTGALHFRMLDEREAEAGRVRQFRIAFDSLDLGGTVTDERKEFIFDGRWLVERMPDEKQIIKREVVRPGETWDPMSVDGPFPLPIGQKRSEILSRFEAELLPAPRADDPDTPPLVAGFHHLRLVARAGEGEDEDLEQVDLWYDPATLLPGRAEIIQRNGDRSTFVLVRREANSGVDPALFDTTLPERGWKVTVEPWK